MVADEWAAFPGGPDDYFPFDHVNGIGPGGQAGASTMGDTPYLIAEWDLPSPIVLLRGDGHTWIAPD